ncbi:single-stranded DNA-binding protein [Flavihumibacter rivuli]|uniref:single-stranded DNA-binding protein n=1 Tax=Flavihumibacter rivuli TaxID=2838156 RepID=UPI001BDF4AD6|nr:single-stranded DNA-binding protein [Flavihumibacter rivuli]ULQ58192.1 single-stranded DNA-binding protein [Flavihumibacter rivuli]
MIKLQVIGNLGKDCVTNNVNGRSVLNFNVAHTEKYRDSQGNQQEKTIWVECAYWTDRTAIAPYLRKGTQVYVEGTPEVRTYPKNDGTTGASLTLRVQNVQLLGSKTEGQQGGYQQPGQQQYGGGNNYGNNSFNAAPAPAMQQPSSMPMEDDLPF